MTAELINAASLIMMVVVTYCVFKMYVAVMVACGERPGTFPVRERPRGISIHGAADRMLAVRRNRQLINHSHIGNRSRPEENDERLC